MTVSRKLERQIRRHLSAKEADTLLAAFAAPSPAQKAGNVTALMRAVNATYGLFEERAKLSGRALDVCSAEFFDVIAARDALTLSIRTVLDSLGQAFVFFDNRGICSDIYSKACLTLLEKKPGGMHVGEVLGLDAEGRQRMQELVDVVFDGKSTIFPFDELMRFAPKRYAHSGAVAVALDYRPMYGPDGKLSAILLIAADISKDVAAQEEIRIKEARIARMLRIAKDKMAFVGFLRKVEQVLLPPSGRKQSMEDFSRDVHTLKGMSKFFHLDILSGILHEMENEMKVRENVTVQEMLDLCHEVVSTLFEEARGYGREIWGNDFEIQEDVVTLPVSDATEFGRELRAQGAQGIAFMYFQKIVAKPVRDLLIPFETQLSFFGVMAEKKISVTMPSSGEIRVYSPVYKDFFDSLVHVARNIVDHAAEPPEQRAAAEKTPELNVWVDVAYGPFKHTMVVTIADDGAGIDTARLREKLGAQANGESEEAVLQHIFDPRVSTRNQVSEESGRGIGLNAVKAVVEKLSGSVHVDSHLGKGTSLTVRLPIIWEPN